MCKSIMQDNERNQWDVAIVTSNATAITSWVLFFYIHKYNINQLMKSNYKAVELWIFPTASRKAQSGFGSKS